MRAKLVFRARFMCALFILVALLLVVRLYFVQVVHGEQYADAAIGQYVETNSEAIDRGSIYFTTKDGALAAAATMQSGWRVAIVPRDIEDADRVLDALSERTEIDQERFAASVAKKDDPYEEVALRLNDEDAKYIRARKLPGVLLVGDEWRTYPGGDLAAQVIGFVGFRGERKAGVYGLERSWQDTLALDAAGLYVNPFAEIFANVGDLISSDLSEAKGSIVTSIEPTVQAELEKILDEVRHEYSPRFVGGIVMDPKTGEIVAMANRPAFDPNTYNTVENPALFSNQLVEGRYELGSIMKPLTVAAGIDAGEVDESTTYYDAGCVTRSEKKICNYDGKARYRVPLQEVLNQSLNLGVTYIAEKMGHAAFTNYVKAYLLGERTNIDLPNEVVGDISVLGSGSGPSVNYAAASYGQGISVTPIAMTRALAALANGGKLPPPHVVTHIKYESGITRRVEPSPSIQVLKPDTAERVTRMLVKVFDEALLKGSLKQEHYSIAAKTGTAQIAQPGGGYYPDRYLHSFFGYFPAHEPRFIVFLFAMEPHGAEFASATLAHPFLDITKFLIHYYDIAPDR